jgi:hypothetical protein
LTLYAETVAGPMGEPSTERRRQLEALNLNSLYWQTAEKFDNGHAFFEAVCAHDLGSRGEAEEQPLRRERAGAIYARRSPSGLT